MSRRARREAQPCDPFRPTADPAAYVPRPATERALAALGRAVVRGRSVALCGPPGHGKTLLLRVLALRLPRRFEAVHLPYPALSPREAWLWAAAARGEPAPAAAEASLRARADELAARGGAVLLVIDDAAALPPATARALRRASEEHPGLRLAVAWTETPGDERPAALLAALGPGFARVRLDAPMSARETGRYVRARLTGAGVRARRARRFDGATLARLHDVSGGVPGALLEEADAVLRGARRGALAAALAREEAASGSSPA